MTTLSIRLDPDVRQFYDELAKQEALKPAQKLRSLLTMVARRHLELKSRGEDMIDTMEAPEEELFMAAEPVSRREDAR